MNQILQTNLDTKKSKLIKLKKLLKLQFCFSVIFCVIIIGFISYTAFNLYKKEKYSSKLLNNYNITKLYANLSLDDFSNSDENPYIIGIIEIPKINIYYPVFSNCSDELLKIAPCKFYGNNPGSVR